MVQWPGSIGGVAAAVPAAAQDRPDPVRQGLERLVRDDRFPGALAAAGDAVASPSDLNRFMTGLLGGRLLPAAQLAQMRTTVPAQLWPGARYGLGLVSSELTCGGLAWGHGGDILGFETRNAATDDGRAVTIAVTALPGAVPRPEAAAGHVLELVDTALCG